MLLVQLTQLANGNDPATYGGARPGHVLHEVRLEEDLRKVVVAHLLQRPLAHGVHVEVQEGVQKVPLDHGFLYGLPSRIFAQQKHEGFENSAHNSRRTVIKFNFPELRGGNLPQLDAGLLEFQLDRGQHGVRGVLLVLSGGQLAFCVPILGPLQLAI